MALSSEPQEIVIRPPADLLRLDVGEYVRYRHLLVALIWRNVRVQYGDMRWGVLWASARPLSYVAVFALFKTFSQANLQASIPYPLYVYSGLIVWYYFIEATMEAAGALRSDAHLLTKVYFPRLITPLVPIFANLFGLVLALLPLVLMMVWYGESPTWRLVLLPLVLFPTMLLALGIGTCVASITLIHRDWERALSSALYLGMFVSPVIYAPDMIPSGFRTAYYLNPLVGALESFRAVVFEAQAFPWAAWIYAAGSAVVVAGVGLSIYRGAEKYFADRL